MHSRRTAAAAILAVLAIAPAVAAPASDETLLRKMTQELYDAIAPGHAAVWEEYLDDRMIHVDENGIARGKAELLAEFEPLPPGLVGSITVDKFRMQLFGDTAVVAEEVQEQLDYHGQMLHTRFRSVDTWRRTAQGWRLIGQHVAAVLKDPPAAKLAAAELCAYDGTYRLTDQISTKIACADGALRSEREGRPAALYLPEVKDLFFVAGAPRSRRIFERDDKGRVTGFVDRREGEDIRWTRAKQPAG